MTRSPMLRPLKSDPFLDSRHDLDALHRFTSGRWLRGEREQLPAATSNIVGLGSDGHLLVPCPLHFSAPEIEQQETDEKLWAQGVELMNTFYQQQRKF